MLIVLSGQGVLIIMLSSTNYFKTIEEASVKSFKEIVQTNHHHTNRKEVNQSFLNDPSTIEPNGLRPLECYRFLYNVLTIIGFLWQVYRINYIYLQYDTVVNIIIGKADHYYMPGVTVCLDYNMEDKSTFTRLYPDRVLDHYSPDELRLIFLETPIRIIAREGQTVGQVSINCTVKCSRDRRFIKPSETLWSSSSSSDSKAFCVNVPCSVYSKPRETLSWARNNVIRRCTTYFTWNSTSSPLQEYREDGRELIEFSVSSKGSAVVIFAMHSGCNIPWTEREDFSSLDIDRYSQFTMDYSIIIFRLLQPPYKTNCSDYSEYGVLGRTACIQECEKSLFLKERGTWPLDVPAPAFNTSLAFFPSGFGLRRERAFPLKTLDTCSKKCAQPECSSYIVTFSTKNQNFITSRRNQTNYNAKIYVNRPRAYGVKYIHIPAIDFIAYFTYIGGSISLWFGLSLLSIFDRLPTNYTGKYRETMNR